MTDAHGPFEQGECSGQVALAQGQQTNPVRSMHEAPRVSNCLGNPQPFFSECPALGKYPQLGIVPGEEGTGKHGGQVDLTKAFAAPNTLEGRDGLPQAVNRPTIVALSLVDRLDSRHQPSTGQGLRPVPHFLRQPVDVGT